MNCIKCGREIADSQVFCDHCLDQMSAYPVKPGTPVYLPKRTPVAEKKRNAKPEEPPAQVISFQRKWLRRLFLLCVVLISLMGFLTLALLDSLGVISLATMFGLK